MEETISIIGLDTYLLGLIAFLLLILVFRFRKVIELLTLLQERREQVAAPQVVGFDRQVLSGDCTEEELAAITAVLTQVLPDDQLNIVNLKLIQ